MPRAYYSKQKTRKQKRRRKRKNIFSLVFILFVIFGFYFLMNASFLHYKKIEIDGLWLINEDEISQDVDTFLNSNIAYVIPMKNIFFFAPKEMKSYLLEKYSRIENLHIKTTDKIHIEINERKIDSLWCQTRLAEEQKKESLANSFKKSALENEQCYLLSEKGYSYAESPYFSTFLFLKLFTKQKALLKEYVLGDEKSYQDFLRFIAYMEDNFAFGVEKVYFRDYGDVDIFLYKIGDTYYPELQLRVRYNSNMSYSDILSTLDLTLDHSQFKKDFSNRGARLSYIDARFKNQVSYNFTSNQILENTETNYEKTITEN